MYILPTLVQYPLLTPVIFEILLRFKNRGILKRGQKTSLLASVITQSHISLLCLGCRETEAIDSIFFFKKIKLAASTKLPHAPTIHVPPLPATTTSPCSLQRAATAAQYPIEPPPQHHRTITTVLSRCHHHREFIFTLPNLVVCSCLTAASSFSTKMASTMSW